MSKNNCDASVLVSNRKNASQWGGGVYCNQMVIHIAISVANILGGRFLYLSQSNQIDVYVVISVTHILGGRLFNT